MGNRVKVQWMGMMAMIGVVMAVTGVSAGAGIIWTHDGNTDPTTEAWTAGGTGTTTDAGVTDGAVDAWRIEKTDANERVYKLTPTLPEVTQAATDGWSLKATLRVLDASDTPGLGTEVRYLDGTRRFTMYFGSASDGDPIVRLLGAEGSFSVAAGTIDGGVGTYHTYELRLAPGGATADLYIDDALAFSGYAGSNAVAAGTGPRGIDWGGIGADTGDANFSVIEFSSPTVPEPGSMALLGLGCAAILLRSGSTAP